jgi:thymidylate kinase
MMLRKRSPAEVLSQANKRASRKDKSIMNDERAARDLQPEVRQCYLDILALWNKYVILENLNASVYDLELL